MVAPVARSWLLCALIGVAGTSCGGSDTTVEGAVRAWLRAAIEGRTDRVYQLLAPESQLRLKQLAKRAAVHAGSGARVQPADLLAATVARPRHELSRVELVEQSGDRAAVELIGARSGVRERLALVRIDGHWRVILPSPRDKGS